MKKILAGGILGLGVMLTAMSAGFSQEPQTDHPQANPLAPFERLIGGEWHLDGSYLELEWGVGRTSVRSRSYFVGEGSPRLVSEGIWFWHPGEEEIRGVFTAVDMPAVLFDYTTTFDGDRMVNDLRTYDAAGSETVYVETWELIDDSHYEWRLLADSPDGLQEVMSGTYERKGRGQDRPH
ncbi:MAG: hypothetical protein HKO65_12845 [Gemmatimonadetes bacterium]|nr:hypothetical protein [Gemmatimonadota bacterium]NNM05969.1 hypothetical protein [Gemmatimonadota bacterium]